MILLLVILYLVVDIVLCFDSLVILIVDIVLCVDSLYLLYFESFLLVLVPLDKIYSAISNYLVMW